jgi:hypothetical protein
MNRAFRLYKEMIMKTQRRQIVPSIVLSLSLLALLESWAGPSQAAHATFYTDQTAWTTAVQNSQTSIIHRSFSIVTSALFAGWGPPAVYMGTSPVSYLVNPSSAPLGTAFGGNFDLTPGGNGGGLAFQINFADSTSEVVWGAVNYPSDPTHPNQFWGIVSDTTIESVQPFSNDWTGNGETFNYDLLTLSFPVLHICTVCPIR